MNDYPKMVELEMQIDNMMVHPTTLEVKPLGTLPAEMLEQLSHIFAHCVKEFDGWPELNIGDPTQGCITLRLHRQAKDEDDLEPEQMIEMCKGCCQPYSLWRSDRDELEFWLPGLMDPQWVPVQVKPNITIDKLRAIALEHDDNIQAAIDAVLATQPKLS